MEKIPILIIEDEPIILKDICTMINWEHEGFYIAGTALNGKAGIQAYQKYHPGFIVTDIQMPFMDGLTMMRQIRSENKDVFFLILSSYAEFEYAREAVRLGTESYLLKAELNPGLLLDAIRPIREKIQSRSAIQKLSDSNRLFSLLSDCVQKEEDEIPDKEDILAAFRAYYDSIKEDGSALRQLSYALKECHSFLGITDDDITVPHFDSQDNGLDWIEEQYNSICSLRALGNTHYSPVIMNACKYIQENFGDPGLKIGNIALSVGLSSSRLSVLFKEQTGKTVNDYITDTRISQAVKMLRSGKYKVYEVSELVGYRTSQYFSQTFQQRTGHLPTDYLKGNTR